MTKGLSTAIQLKGAAMDNDSNGAVDSADQFDRGVATGATVCVLLGGILSTTFLVTLARLMLNNI
jgi:hypothetical protein